MEPPQSAQRLERLPISWLHYRLLLIQGVGWLFDAMDVGIITFVLAVLARDWKLPSDQIGLIGSAGLGGMFIGAALSGLVADYWGRKRVFQITLLLYSIATLLCATAWNVTSMIVFRFVVGIGLGGELPVVSSLLSEFIPRGRRGRFIVLLESFWAFGWLLAALVAFLVIPNYGWRIAFGIGSLPAFYVWIIRRSLPESPRWYESKGRFEEAEAVLETLEAESKQQTGLPADEIVVHIHPVSQVNRGLTVNELWSQNYRRRTIMLCILWFGLVFGYYGIFIWLPTLLVKAGYSLVNSFLYVLIITIAQIPGYFSAGYLIERIGRRSVVAIYLLCSAVAALLFGYASTTAQILIWASVLSFANLGAWGAVYAYTPELFPTRARATGAGFVTAFGRIGGVLAPIIVGILLPLVNRSGVLVINAGMFVIAALAVIVLGIETKGKTLEEVSQ